MTGRFDIFMEEGQNAYERQLERLKEAAERDEQRNENRGTGSWMFAGSGKFGFSGSGIGKIASEGSNSDLSTKLTGRPRRRGKRKKIRLTNDQKKMFIAADIAEFAARKHAMTYPCEPQLFRAVEALRQAALSHGTYDGLSTHSAIVGRTLEWVEQEEPRLWNAVRAICYALTDADYVLEKTKFYALSSKCITQLGIDKIVKKYR